MTLYKIERTVPLPVPVKTRNSKYPFRAMKVGESFTVPCSNDTVHRVQINAMSATRPHKPKRFASRVERDGKAVRIRIWRTA